MQAQSQTGQRSVWQLDRAHSSVEFSVKKLFFLTISGRMNNLEGQIVLDEDTVADSSFEVNIKVGTLTTGNQHRDRQFRSKLFLDASNHPYIRFVSAQIGPGLDRDTLKVKGGLTIKDKSRDLVLEVTEVDRSKAPNGEEVIYYAAETELNRFDFGITAWRGIVGSRLKVVINVQASREK